MSYAIACAEPGSGVTKGGAHPEPDRVDVDEVEVGVGVGVGFGVT
jgi:hypothetical protein